jgi:Protein of unknown function (DUF402)
LPFAEGSTAVRRDTLGGKIWSAAPYRVVLDTGGALMLCMWPGTQMVGPANWIESQRANDAAIRKRAVPDLAAGTWEVGRWTWRDTTVLSRFSPGDYFSVHRYFDAGQHCGGWYVNFERPCQRTRIGIDTFDLFLDLVVEPDLSGYAWKDEDEYAQARRIGLIDDALHARVDAARQQVLALIQAGQGPFAENWSAWQRQPDWPLPVLPAEALTEPAAG